MADVAAATGYLAFPLAEAVGPKGTSTQSTRRTRCSTPARKAEEWRICKQRAGARGSRPYRAAGRMLQHLVWSQRVASVRRSHRGAAGGGAHRARAGAYCHSRLAARRGARAWSPAGTPDQRGERGGRVEGRGTNLFPRARLAGIHGSCKEERCRRRRSTRSRSATEPRLEASRPTEGRGLPRDVPPGVAPRWRRDGARPGGPARMGPRMLP